MFSSRFPLLVVSRLSLLVALSFAACEHGADRIVPPSGEAGPNYEHQQALVTALDTLEALVATLERVNDPVSAWNRAAEASRLLTELERTRPAYVLRMSEEEALRRYPAEIARLQQLEARRDAELDRILADPIAGRVLLEAMGSAEREARLADTLSTP